MKYMYIFSITLISFVYSVTINAEMDGFNLTSYQELMAQQQSPKDFKLKNDSKYKVVNRTKDKNKENKKTKRSRQKRKKSNTIDDKKLSFEEMSIMMANRR